MDPWMVSWTGSRLTGILMADTLESTPGGPVLIASRNPGRF